MVTLNRNEVVTLNWKTVVNITEFYTLATTLIISPQNAGLKRFATIVFLFDHAKLIIRF